MALDAQRNWDVSMAENLDHIMKQKDKRQSSFAPSASKFQDEAAVMNSQRQAKAWDREPVYLPDELLVLIIECVARTSQSQRTLASCCLLSRQWWRASVPYLYRSPHVEGSSFIYFLESVCPSIHEKTRDSRTAPYIRTLDLSRLVHEARSSLTARLLGRVKYQLEVFVAPQATFNSACLAPLGKSKRLQVLDLSLVSQPPSLQDLFKHICNLRQLTVLRLPRSAGFGGKELRPETFTWPPSLQDLHLSGGIDLNFCNGRIALPQTLRHLSIDRCPKARGPTMMRFIATAVRPLQKLKSMRLSNLPQVDPHDLSDILAILPYIPKLSISVDYIGPQFFDYKGAEVRANFMNFADYGAWTSDSRDSLPVFASPAQKLDQPPYAHLQILELTNSGDIDANPDDRINPVDIIVALEEGVLPLLRQVRVAKSLKWQEGETALEMDALVDALAENAVTWKTTEEQRKEQDHLRIDACENAENQRKEGRGGIDDPETGVWLIDG